MLSCLMNLVTTIVRAFLMSRHPSMTCLPAVVEFGFQSGPSPHRRLHPLGGLGRGTQLTQSGQARPQPQRKRVAQRIFSRGPRMGLRCQADALADHDGKVAIEQISSADLAR